jgi:hypothetical protein
MDKGLWTMIIMVGGTFVFIAVVAFIYFYQQYSSITAELARINKLALAGKMEDAHADVMVLWDRHPRVIDIGCLAVDIAIAARKHQDAIEHAEVCLRLLDDPQHVNLEYFELLLQRSEHINKKNQGFLKYWLNYSILRAHFDRCYSEYDYAAALACVETHEKSGAYYPAQAQSLKAYFHMLQGHYEEAKAHLDAARQADAQDKQYLAIQGHWHLIHGEQAEAVKFYRLHDNWKSIEEDFHHIQQVFNIKTPEQRMVTS